jgi:hypothetical protein
MTDQWITNESKEETEYTTVWPGGEKLTTVHSAAIVLKRLQSAHPMRIYETREAYDSNGEPLPDMLAIWEVAACERKLKALIRFIRGVANGEWENDTEEAVQVLKELQ